MYLRKISPSMTCLYSAASIDPRRASAIAHSWASWPVVAPLFGVAPAPFRRLPDVLRAIAVVPVVRLQSSRADRRSVTG